MSKLVRVDPEAEAEIAEAIDRYERAREAYWRRRLSVRDSG